MLGQLKRARAEILQYKINDKLLNAKNTCKEILDGRTNTIETSEVFAIEYGCLYCSVPGKKSSIKSN